MTRELRYVTKNWRISLSQHQIPAMFFFCLACRLQPVGSRRKWVSHYLLIHTRTNEVNAAQCNRNRNLKTSKALLKSQAHQGTSLFTSAATNQRGVSKGGSREAQVRIPEYQEGTE